MLPVAATAHKQAVVSLNDMDVAVTLDCCDCSVVIQALVIPIFCYLSLNVYNVMIGLDGKRGSWDRNSMEMVPGFLTKHSRRQLNFIILDWNQHYQALHRPCNGQEIL